jgi:GAF domain-containing protein
MRKLINNLLSQNFLEEWIKDITLDTPPAKLLRTSDPRLRERAGLLYRVLGFVLCVIVSYLSVFDFFRGNQARVWLWVGAYVAYLLLLEVLRVRRRDYFDNSIIRGARIIINICAITYLLHLSTGAQAIVGLFFIIPIFATIIYFPQNKVAILLTFCFSLLGLYLGGRLINSATPLSYIQTLFISLMLLVFSYGFSWFYNNVVFGSDIISHIAVHLHQTLDLQEVTSYIVEAALKLTPADRALVIITDPRHQEYMNHAAIGFELRPGYSIEELAKKCAVINNGIPFSCPDLTTHYNNKDIYSTFFTCRPKSVIAAPLFNKEGAVIGVLNIASDKSNRFDGTINDWMLGFSYIVSGAVENSLVHRQAKLREIRNRDISLNFAKAHNEREILNLVLKESKTMIPNVNCIIHRYEKHKSPRTGSEELILNPLMWDAENYQETNTYNYGPLRFRYGQGLAGHALKLREPILVNDVRRHPWFVPGKHDRNIKSLLVCPLFDPNGLVNYGTISLYDYQTDAFTPEDELSLTFLAHQASLAISKVREFEEWQEHGGLLQKILNEVRFFDFGASEEKLCNQIVEAACKLLNFKIARLRLTETMNNELVTVAVSGLPQNEIKQLIGHKMPFTVLEPFFDHKYNIGKSYILPHDDPRWREIAEKHFYIPEISEPKRSEWKPYDALLTPILGASGQTIGLLTLDLPKDGIYPAKNTIEPLGLFASMVGWAIELSRYQRRFIDQKARTKSFIETISDELVQGHDFQTLGEVVVQIGAKLISTEGCSLFIVRENEIELTHSTYLAGTDYVGRRKPIGSQPSCGLTGYVAETGKILIFNNETYKHHPSWAGEEEHLVHLPSQRCKSVLLVPIIDADKNILGVLSLENKRRVSDFTGFDEEDITRVNKLAQQVAIALVRIGKFEAMKKWESKGLEDDLHFLINWYRFGVLARMEQLEDTIYEDNLPKAKQLLPDLMRNARQSVNELKALHTLIINQCLEASDLKEGLERLIEAWQKRVVPVHKEKVPMQIMLDCEANLPVETALRNTVLRIASEALSNSIFHSGVIENPNVKIKVAVLATDKKITLKVIDNGMGVKVIHRGFGLDRMNQLTQQVNSWGGIVARLKINSKFQKGTSVSFSATYKHR